MVSIINIAVSARKPIPTVVRRAALSVNCCIYPRNHHAGGIRHQIFEQIGLDVNRQILEYRKCREHRQGYGHQRHQRQQSGKCQTRSSLRTSIMGKARRNEIDQSPDILKIFEHGL